VPIYEYLCESCAYRFERKQSIKEEPVATCERCGKSVTRLISSPAIMFKGSGWYVTDYSDKLKPPASSEPAAATPENKTPAEKKESPASTTTSPASPAAASAPSSESATKQTSGSTASPATPSKE
jgi:putative FmdB family regulatory protein